MNKKIVLLIVFLLLSGCSLLSPVKPAEMNTYMLNTLPTHLPRKKPRHLTLLIVPPVTSPAYNTTQMAYSTRPFQLAYFAKNQWGETPSQMLLPLLVEAFQRTHYFHAVVTPPYMDQYDYSLNMTLLQLQQEVTHQHHVIRLKAQVELSQTGTHQVIASQLFSVNEPLTKATPYDGVIAANIATAKLLEQIIEFSFKHLH